MFVIVTYDIGAKRGVKSMKICKKYLHHVQRSVFEGNITERKLKKMKGELESCIIRNIDSICIYQLGSLKYTSKIQIGVVESEGYLY